MMGSCCYRVFMTMLLSLYSLMHEIYIDLLWHLYIITEMISIIGKALLLSLWKLILLKDFSYPFHYFFIWKRNTPIQFIVVIWAWFPLKVPGHKLLLHVNPAELVKKISLFEKIAYKIYEVSYWWNFMSAFGLILDWRNPSTLFYSLKIAGKDIWAKYLVCTRLIFILNHTPHVFAYHLLLILYIL